jgi:hypothetical protein
VIKSKKKPPYFFKPGEKVYYKGITLPWIKATFSNNYVWQWNDAPCHTVAAKKKVLFSENMANFRPQSQLPEGLHQEGVIPRGLSQMDLLMPYRTVIAG